MKIGLLSFHNAANYGAALQAFALQKALNELNIENEYIDYQNTHRVNRYSVSFLIFSSIKKGDFKGAFKYFLGSPFLLMRKFKFNFFYKKYLKKTDKIYRNSKDASSLNECFDKFIVGSDQVWNWTNNGGDDSFLLSFVINDNKKISYSSSFGVAEIPEKLKDTYKKNLSKFSSLAVREEKGVEIIHNLINRKPLLVLDPVFLLSKEQWLQISDSKLIEEKFVFSYTNKVNQLERFLHTTKYNIDNTYLYKLSRHLTINDFIKKDVRVKYSMSPTKFLSVIRDSELVVSASFHCISLAIILNKPFIAILTGDKGKDSRVTNILTLLGLEDRIYSDSMTKNDVLNRIDFDRVNKRIDKLKSESLDYLLTAVYNGN